MTILSYVKKNYNNFTSTEKKIANYILNTEDDLLNLSSKDLGKLTNTSAATVIRFSKKLGLDSFNELKLKVSICNAKNTVHKPFDYIGKDLSTKNIISGIKHSITSTIDETIDLIKEKDLDKAINILRDANNICIYGIGVSSLVGMDLYYKLIRINKKSTCNIDSHLQMTSSILMNKDDVALIISYSGNTHEIISIAENCKKLNVPIISITRNSLNNKLAKISDINLYIPYIEKDIREGAMSSRLSQLTIIDMLFIGISKDNINDIENNLIKTRKIIDQYNLR
ncbi:MurR/RpiR family transcriptional regulator [Clostridium oceanicum]|uniref:MurR/RpiR family transcriptional regulator n=1 Tax=Clostridium oceanicum TaxID=1543 RepID=A0ABP3UF10_9CLOT